MPLLAAAQEGFHAPVDIPIYLSGTFGEPRGSHFHSGIDIKTNGREGLNIYAIEDGYVSRIKVSSSGYGNALYIDHPNGCTSVYAHLQRFNEGISKYINKIHYQKESFELDEYLPSGTLLVKRGEIIALSGNSGGSGGPHLHFEIRDTKSQIPVNPHQYGFAVTDNIAPGIFGLYLYPKDANLVESVKIDVKHNGSTYKVAGDTIFVNTDTLGIGLHTTDKMNGSSNTNGVYAISVAVNGDRLYSYTMDRFSFDDTRYAQCHMDYKEKSLNKNSVHRCFLLPGNYLDNVYQIEKNRGYVVVPEGETREVSISTSDYNQNEATLRFHVKHTPDSKLFARREEPFDTVFYPDRSNTFATEHIKASFATHSFYNKVYWQYGKAIGKSTDMKSAMHALHHEWEPVHKRYTVSIKTDEPEALRKHLILVRVDMDGDVTTYPSRVSGNWITGRPKDLGDFYLTLDTIAPTIKPLNVHDGKVVTGQGVLKFTVKDNLTDIASYKGTLNGQWLLMKYDAKNSLLYYEFDEKLTAGEHKLSVIVTDEAGNTGIFNCNIKN